jgi:hypothetical protein
MAGQREDKQTPMSGNGRNDSMRCAIHGGPLPADCQARFDSIDRRLDNIESTQASVLTVMSEVRALVRLFGGGKAKTKRR